MSLGSTSDWLASYLLGRRPPGVPRAYWESIGWFRVLMVVLGMAILGLAALNFITEGDSPWPLLLFIGTFLFAWFVPRIFKRRMRRFVIARDFLVCTECRYDLRELQENRCPECGTSFAPREVQLAWSRWLGAEQKQGGT